MSVPRGLLWLLAGLVVGCDPGEEPRVCVDAGAALAACESVPVPTYSELYANVLVPSCGLPGVSCHGAGSNRVLSFVDEDESRRYLLEHRVVPGAAGCSELFLRVRSSDPFFRMPPAEILSETDQCAIARWIEAGAP